MLDDDASSSRPTPASSRHARQPRIHRPRPSPSVWNVPSERGIFISFRFDGSPDKNTKASSSSSYHLNTERKLPMQQPGWSPSVPSLCLKHNMPRSVSGMNTRIMAQSEMRSGWMPSLSSLRRRMDSPAATSLGHHLLCRRRRQRTTVTRGRARSAFTE